MKKKMLRLTIMLVCLLAFAPMAMADYTVTLLSASPYTINNGGEFTFTTGGLPLSGYVSGQTIDVVPNGSNFQTFCLEVNEYINWGGSYTAQLSNAAIAGGMGGGSPDPISIGTAYLYSQFAKGTLSGYDYSPTASRKTSAGYLQQTIWALEDEIGGGGYPSNPSNPFPGIVTTALGMDWTGVKANANRAYGVMVLNLYSGTTYKQDQLVVTPIPPAVWLLGTGLVGLFGIRRRFVS